MSFPEEYTVNRNLRELWAEVRRLSRAKAAGHTSLGPDDGAMEIRNAAGTAVAKVGHEGGAGGLLVRNRDGTSWVSIADERTRIDGRVDSVWSSVDSHAGRLSTAEGGIGALQTASSSQAGRISTLEGHRTRIDGRVDSVWSSVDSHAGRISTLEGHRTRIDGRIDSVWISVDSHAGRLSGLESSRTTMQAQIQNLTNRIIALENPGV